MNYETLLGENPFLLQGDDERRIARREELKWAVADIMVKELMMSENDTCIKKLSDRIDTAVAIHGEKAAKIHAETPELTERRIRCIKDGTPLSAKDAARQMELTEELVAINRTLEIETAADQAAILQLDRKNIALRKVTTVKQALMNALSSLCSPTLRRKRKFIEHKLQLSIAGLKAAQRSLAILGENRKIHAMNHDRNLIAISESRSEDARDLVAMIGAEITSMHEESARLQAAALAE